jgi:virginiamycin B lyase
MSTEFRFSYRRNRKAQPLIVLILATGAMAQWGAHSAIVRFPLPESSYPTSITAGPDGGLWFTGYDGNNIGRVATAGEVTGQFAAPDNPEQIAAGPDGDLWFTEIEGTRIGRISINGVVREYSVPNTNSLDGITGGPDGAVWFTEAGKVGRITSTEVCKRTESRPGAGSSP